MGTLSALTPEAKRLLEQAAERSGMSARGYHRTLRVARTIADLADCPEIETDHLAEAVSYRLTSEAVRPVAAVRSA